MKRWVCRSTAYQTRRGLPLVQLLGSQREKQSVQTQNVELRTLARNLDASREALTQRLSTTITGVQQNDQQLSELQQENRNLQRELGERTKRVQDLEQALQVCFYVE